MVTTPDLPGLAEAPSPPTGRAGPAGGTAQALAEVLASVVGAEQVAVDSHFFDDLGADSMLMAQFCARVRKRTDLPSVSIKDIYRHPTIRSLAAALEDADPARPGPPVPTAIETPARVTTGQYVLCGTLQLLAFSAYTYLAAVVGVRGYEWIVQGSGPTDVYLRSALFGSMTFLGLCSLPVVAKWVLIGRWQAQEIRIWSLGYFRFWLIKTLVHFSPMRLLAGSPLYVVYLRALGAKVGAGVVIFSRAMPVCTDLLTIGDGTVIRKDSFFTCYRAHGGVIQTGRVTLGKDVVVSEATVLDIETTLGDGAQLGHRSSLHAGQVVPEGQRWHGSPAQPTDVDYRLVEAADCPSRRRAFYVVLQLGYLLLLDLPLAIGGVGILVAELPQLNALLGPVDPPLTGWTFYRVALTVSLALFFGALLLGLLVATTVPRLLKRAIKPDKVYRLYGFHYGVHRAIARMTNIKFLATLYGDSSYIVPYLRGLGYDLSDVMQTGSNFGTELGHESPFLTSVGRGTMVADGLSVMNADFSSTSFRVSRATIGADNFLGNSVAYPWQSKTGDNCLLATKVMVPIDGPLRENVGLLGSPCFEIPRSVQRDSRFDHMATGAEFRRRLAAKNRYNRRTMALFLLVRWVNFFAVTLIAMAGAALYHRAGTWAVGAASIVLVVFTTAYSILVERAVSRFRSMSPKLCSIYEPYFWWHERHWKLLTSPNVLNLFNGTPFKGLLWRLAGARIGRRLFDDGCGIPERTMVAIGDDCILNAGSEIQSHSQEDGTFKSDRITVGAGCTIGTGALVHYGVTMGDGAVLAPDSFLMKGEEMPPAARWAGNPARLMAGTCEGKAR